MGDTAVPSVPPPNETVICLLGDLKIDQQRLSVGVISGKETLVQLEKPAPLGNALTVGSWLNDSWSTKVDALLVKSPDGNGKVGSQSDVKQADVEKHLRDLGFPTQICTSLSQIFLAQIIITDLYIRLWKEQLGGKEVDRRAFKFGIAVNFANKQNEKGLNLFGEIYLENVKFGLINAPKGYNFKDGTIVLPSLRTLTYEEVRKEAERKTTWRSVLADWRDGIEDVDAQIAALAAAMRASGDAAMKEIASRRMNELTADLNAELMAALKEIGDGDNASMRKSGPKALAIAWQFLDHIETDERVASCEDNRFGLPLTIRKTLKPALTKLMAAIEAGMSNDRTGIEE